jgi:hypothetical protein
MNKEGGRLIIVLCLFLCSIIYVAGVPPPPPNITIIPPSTCTVTNGGVEICDNIDNDCDGSIDEYVNTTSGCYTAGFCSGAYKTCSLGNWSVCSKVPGTEICNGVDDDCDNLTDENLTTSAGCNQIGYCSGAYKVCSAGNWSSCSKVPINESCNGINDDCDNLTDENLTRITTCGGKGICANNTGFEICVLGNWTGNNCNPYAGATTEVCDDLFKDENCNGISNENCSCISGINRTCGSNIGECKLGTQLCLGGLWSATCSGAIGPQTEVCDNKDNDCDNLTDENLTDSSGCNQEGYCKGAVRICSSKVWSTCSKMPTEETCNAIDDDCDGEVDEDVCAVPNTAASSGSSGSGSGASSAPRNAASPSGSSGSGSSGSSLKSNTSSLEKSSGATVNTSLLDTGSLSDKVNNLSMSEKNKNLFTLFKGFSVWKVIIVIVISLCIITFLSIFIVDYSRKKALGEKSYAEKLFANLSEKDVLIPANNIIGNNRDNNISDNIQNGNMQNNISSGNVRNYSQTKVNADINRREILNNFNELSPQEMQALNYIAAMRQRGFTDDYIYAQLLSKGWQENVLMNLFKR